MVSRKKRRRTDETARRRHLRLDLARRRDIERNMDRQVTYFFTLFPDDHGATEMLRIFSMYGDATEVVIPAKRDKLGRRFGFVRFMEVRDVKLFATKLDNIIIGATKIHANIPRFTRDEYIRRADQYPQKKVEASESEKDRKGIRMEQD